MNLSKLLRVSVILFLILWACLSPPTLFKSLNARSVTRISSATAADGEGSSLKRLDTDWDNGKPLADVKYSGEVVGNTHHPVLQNGRVASAGSVLKGQLIDQCEGLHVYIYEDMAATLNAKALAGCHKMGRGYDMCDKLENEGRGRVIPELCKQDLQTKTGAIELQGVGKHWLEDGGKLARRMGSVNEHTLENGGKLATRLGSVNENLLESDGRPATRVGSCSWFDTGQFTLELLLHSRLKAHPCRVNDPSDAQLFFVPVYIGLELLHNWGNLSKVAVNYNHVFNPLVKSKYYQRSQGADHFVVFGRMGMEFAFYGAFASLLKDVTKVMIEVGCTGRGSSSPREIGVPYPTGFHPATLADLAGHQERATAANRDLLVSFAGAVNRRFSRWGQRWGTAQSRQHLATQCAKMGAKCRHVVCWTQPGNCSPKALSELFMRSTFCLQPQGDTPTRRSTFDALLSGCIPVFFRRDSFETQYQRFLGVNASSVSVLIPQNQLEDPDWSLEAELEAIDEKTRADMREVIVEIMPRIVYGSEHVGSDWKDAVDYTLEAVQKVVAL